MNEFDPTPPEDAVPETLVREAQEWLVLLTSGRATGEDAAALRRWCDRSTRHAHAFAETNLLWETLGACAPGRAAAPAALGTPRRAAFVDRRSFLGVGAAAIASIGYLAMRPPLHLWPSAFELAADYRTQPGERRRLATPGGVEIELNTRTAFNVGRDGEDERLELVSGEVAIESAKGDSAPSTIAAAGGQVHIVDAEINLRCDGTRAVVTCRRGAVRVDYSGRSISLTEGRQIAYANGALDPAVDVDAAVVAAWRQGQLVFRQAPLREVVDEINRYRSGRIVLANEALARRLVEARLPLERLDDIIALVREAYGARVTSLPSGILILS